MMIIKIILPMIVKIKVAGVMIMMEMMTKHQYIGYIGNPPYRVGFPVASKLRLKLSMECKSTKRVT